MPGERIGLKDVPYHLRANDFQRHIINIDSRFRENSDTTTASNFFFLLPNTIRNIIRIRLTSIEFPNNYYQFTEKRMNVCFRVVYKVGDQRMGLVVCVPEGNYTACEMEAAINKILEATPEVSWLSVKFIMETGKFEFTGSQLFGIDMTYETKPRTFDYGLGYHLGFKRKLYRSACEMINDELTWKLVSDCPANFAGDSYLFLRVNDYTCVRHTFYGNTLNVFAKVIINQAKNDMTFDDYAGDHIKEVVLTGPEDLKRIHIQVLDAYGEVVDLTCTNFSFSLEILEVMNVNLFNAFRNSLSMPYLITDPARSGGPPSMI
jgi:hypothetical protein